MFTDPHRIHRRLPVFTLSILTLAMGLTRPAVAQDSEADLQRQVQQLTTQVEDLQRQLEQEREKNAGLEVKVAQLEEQLAAARRSRPTSPTPMQPHDDEEITIDESIPNASPRALFKAIAANYDEAFEDLSIGRPGDRERRVYLRRLANWRAGLVREFRAPITWHVRVVDAHIDLDGRRIATLVAVDPKSDVRLGDSFDVALSPLLADRLSRYESRHELDVLVLRGTLTPDVRINPDREERGTFDNPPFIGPFAEFLFRVDVTSLQPPRPSESVPAGD